MMRYDDGDDEYCLPKHREHHDHGECEYWDPLLEFLLFEEILPRLPVQSLLRFKLVSKKWLHYITTDPGFIYNHLRRQSQTTKFSLIHAWTKKTFLERIFMFDSRTNRAEIRDVSAYMERLFGLFYRFNIVGSCNGLTCFHLEFGNSTPNPLVVHRDQERAIVLWNLETGEGRDTLVPPLPSSFHQLPGEPNLQRKLHDYPVYGFGFDAYRDDYKVVRIFPTQPTLLNFDVFTRNTGCWRRLDRGLLGYTVFAESSESVLVNGCLYWLVLAVENTSKERRCILSFNLHDEEFLIIDVLEREIYYDAFPLRHRVVKWKENSLAYLSFPNVLGHSFDFRVQLVLDSNGNVVIGGQNVSSARGLSWSSKLLSPFFTPSQYWRSGWRFCGVSQGRLFVIEFDPRPDASTSKLITYDDSFGCAGEIIGRQELLMNSCHRPNNAVHDYVPSLVSVYANRKMMMEEKKKMEVKFWVDMFWKTMGLNKQQFGLAEMDEL